MVVLVPHRRNAQVRTRRRTDKLVGDKEVTAEFTSSGSVVKWDLGTPSPRGVHKFTRVEELGQCGHTNPHTATLDSKHPQAWSSSRARPQIVRTCGAKKCRSYALSLSLPADDRNLHPAQSQLEAANRPSRGRCYLAAEDGGVKHTPRRRGGSVELHARDAPVLP
eukprot:scaffold32195_cov65-Phaeocystis_antarctica.AAC.5